MQAGKFSASIMQPTLSIRHSRAVSYASGLSMRGPQRVVGDLDEQGVRIGALALVGGSLTIVFLHHSGTQPR